jgi:hypothetical protein
MFVNIFLNDMWEMEVKFGTAVLFINTPIKYVAVTIHVNDFFFREKQKNRIF